MQVLVPVADASQEAAATPAPAPTGACTYTVKSGDTLFEIARVSELTS